MFKLFTRCLIVPFLLTAAPHCFSEDKAKSEQTSTPAISVNKKVVIQKKTCTDLPVSEWLSEEEFLILMRHRGYKDFKFKVIYQSCYEIYGYDAKNQLIEAYFNPTNAKLSRSNTVKTN